MSETGFLMYEVSGDLPLRETLCTILAPYLTEAGRASEPIKCSPGDGRKDVVVVLVQSADAPEVHLMSWTAGQTASPPAATVPGRHPIEHCFGLVRELVLQANRLRGPQAEDEPKGWEPRAMLTPREVDVLRGLQRGDSNKEIARRLKIAEATVKVHIRRVLNKTRTHNRTQAALWAGHNIAFSGNSPT